MTDEEFLAWLQISINYTFHERYLLQTALITPGFEGIKDGSEEEAKKYEGNRISAQLGDSLISLVVRYQVLYVDRASRGRANDTLTTVTSKKYQEERGKFLGIKAHMKINELHTAEGDPKTLRLTLCAIIGAVWRDCDRNFDVIMGVVNRLLIGPKLSPYVDPMALSGEQVATPPVIFDEWLHNHGSPSESAPFDLLNVPGAELSDSQNDLNIPSNRDPTTAVLDAQASSIDNVGRSQQRATESIQIRGTPDSNLAPRLNLMPLISKPSSRSEHLLTHSSYVEPTEINSEATSTPTTQLLPTRDGEVDSITSSRSLVPSKKRKSSSNNTTGYASISDHLIDYMRLETEKHHSQGSSFSPNDFDEAMTRLSLTLMKDNNMLIRLKMLFFMIGSSESVVRLKNMVEIGRRSITGNQPTAIGSLTTLERMKVVERLSTKIACNVFERRYHIYHLLVDSRAAHQKTSDGFINSTWQSVSTSNTRRIGNPLSLDESQLSKSLLEKLYPALIPDTAEYKKKLRSMSSIRKLGERLEVLVERFGYGIIGLLPLPADDLAADQFVSHEQSNILTITDPVFASFVQCLEQLKGKFLRDISHAVCPIVTTIFEKKWSRSDTFAIERLEQSQIFQHPSGSPKLLELILSG